MTRDVGDEPAKTHIDADEDLAKGRQDVDLEGELHEQEPRTESGRPEEATRR